MRQTMLKKALLASLAKKKLILAWGVKIRENMQIWFGEMVAGKKLNKMPIVLVYELHRGKQCLVVNCFPTAQLTSEVVGVLKFGWLTIAAIVILLMKTGKVH